MTGTALMALLSHWRRKPGQLATLIMGLGLATALWTSVQAINAEARASYDEETKKQLKTIVKEKIKKITI